jgi:hypothetical protein
MAIPFTIITLDRPRKIRLGYSVIVEFEETTGIKIQSLGTETSLTTYMKLLWVMLKQEDPTLTFKGMLELIDDNCDDLGDVVSKINNTIESGSAKSESPNA